MRDHKDKLVLDLTDDEKLAEYFSRKAPGSDECVFSGKATIDENHEGMVVLSITEINFQKHKEKDAAAAADESAPAVKMAKRRKAAEAEEQEGMGY